MPLIMKGWLISSNRLRTRFEGHTWDNEGHGLHFVPVGWSSCVLFLLPVMPTESFSTLHLFQICKWGKNSETILCCISESTYTQWRGKVCMPLGQNKEHKGGNNPNIVIVIIMFSLYCHLYFFFWWLSLWRMHQHLFIILYSVIWPHTSRCLVRLVENKMLYFPSSWVWGFNLHRKI